jgi:cyanophycinase
MVQAATYKATRPTTATRRATGSFCRWYRRFGVDNANDARYFLLLGAGEFLPWSENVERRMLQLAQRGGPIAVLPTASAPEGDAVFDRWGRMGLDHYAQLGHEAQIVNLKTRDDAFDPEVIAAIDAASMVFFSGGNPAYLARTLDGTPSLDALTRGLADGMIFAGCSAGAMVAGARVKKTAGPGFRSAGLGLVEHVRFGVHWNRVPSLPGLKRLMTAGSEGTDVFVGIDEMTAIAGNGVRWRVFGAGRVEVRRHDARSFFSGGEEFSLD